MNELERILVFSKSKMNAMAKMQSYCKESFPGATESKPGPGTFKMCR